ncbi:D-glycero-alpha-D-manno-heptose-1,7-bisphosphate 7-phosphatase [Peredibacter sp. HCB2-198]|uniref:D-glycero-alpha-D-manno-heptose-1,7-bisphosphate 7-phosphatase n=1 Tax=Peredibacter sp. HCB2-198 TaxID=3383025 RepID=UPI0038B66D52
MGPRAIFFDKDGTLIEDVPFNVDVSKIKFSNGADFAIQKLKDLFQFHIVTNQKGIALGLFQEIDLTFVRNKMAHMFQELGGELHGFHYCPHGPEDGCECRKPGSLMLEKAAKEHGIILQRSWMIGDILDDIEAGKRAGCKTILINNGHETEWVMNEFREPDHVAQDLFGAALIILAQEWRL